MFQCKILCHESIGQRSWSMLVGSTSPEVMAYLGAQWPAQLNPKWCLGTHATIQYRFTCEMLMHASVATMCCCSLCVRDPFAYFSYGPTTMSERPGTCCGRTRPDIVEMLNARACACPDVVPQRSLVGSMPTSKLNLWHTRVSGMDTLRHRRMRKLQSWLSKSAK